MKYTNENIEGVRFSIYGCQYIVKEDNGINIIVAGSHKSGKYTEKCCIVVERHIEYLNNRSNGYSVYNEQIVYEIY